MITFLLLMDGHQILDFGYRQMSPEREARTRKVAKDISDAIAGYVFGNFVISVAAGIVTYVTLTNHRRPVRAAAGDPVRLLRPDPAGRRDAGGILVGIVVAFVSFPGGLIVWVAVLIVYQQIENNIIQPVVYGQTVQIHPLVVIIAVLIGAPLLGVLGALIAIPAAAALQSVVRDFWHFDGARTRR